MSTDLTRTGDRRVTACSDGGVLSARTVRPSQPRAAPPQLVLPGDAMRHLDGEAQEALAPHPETCGATTLRHPVLNDRARRPPMAA